jgi:hypothetical protein
MSSTKFKSRALTCGLAILGLWLSGCAKEKSNDSNQVNAVTDRGGTPLPPPGVGATGDNHPFNTMAGGTAPFTFDSVATLNTYVQVHPVNNPQNMKVNVQLSDLGGGRMGGNVKLGYYDSGNYFIGDFTSGTGVNNVSYQNLTTGLSEAEYNRWFVSAGKKVFHGFFQDRYGAVILVVDGGIDLGDGGGYSQVNGSVYFKNFQVSSYAQTAEKCWFIWTGPYECRTFLVGQLINTVSALLPANGFQKLGSFQALDKIKGFGR